MPAIGIGMLWGAYTIGFWGFTLIKGYDISPVAIIIPGKWKGTWPPPAMPNTQVLGQGSAGAAQTGPASPPAPGAPTTPANPAPQAGLGGLLNGLTGGLL